MGCFWNKLTLGDVQWNSSPIDIRRDRSRTERFETRRREQRKIFRDTDARSTWRGDGRDHSEDRSSRGIILGSLQLSQQLQLSSLAHNLTGSFSASSSSSSSYSSATFLSCTYAITSFSCPNFCLTFSFDLLSVEILTITTLRIRCSLNPLTIILSRASALNFHWNF